MDSNYLLFFIHIIYDHKKGGQFMNMIIDDCYCVMCGCYIPEGTMVCPECIKKVKYPSRDKKHITSNQKKGAVSK